MESLYPPSVFPGLYTLAWAIPSLAIVSVPVLIHLINMLRHRRVEWAAMEFLLLSQKKHRTWIILKQLLLLLLRMAAVAAVVFIVAQPLLYNQWGNLLGGATTHHIVLLDDSFSMSDRWGDTSAFNEAKKVIRRLGEQAAEQSERQAFTLIRFSRCGGGRKPDLSKETVNKGAFLDQLNSVLNKIEVSETAAEPVEALRLIIDQTGEAEGERRVVYLLSDFRARQWKEPSELRNLLLELNASNTEVYLINCVDQARPNLAITELAPVEGIRAAGVSFFMKVTVHNYGRTAVRNVPVLLEEDGSARPAVTFSEIPAGRSATEQFEVNFPTAGEHVITARLEPDPVAADNRRYCLLNLPAEVPVLLIDGSPDQLDAKCIAWASAPGGSVRTGIRPQIETPRFLSIKTLDEFRAVYVLNVDRLEKSAIAALERFLQSGGGVGFFVGDNTGSAFFNNQLYRNGEGIFPVPLKAPAELPIDRVEQAPCILPTGPEVFQDFVDDSSLLARVLVQKYYAVADGWRPPPESTVQILARLRNGAPFAVRKTWGKEARGRVVAILTTAAPVWNNWTSEPSFVPVVHRMHQYLVGQPPDTSRLVGTPLKVEFAGSEYLPTMWIFTPGDDSSPAASFDAQAGPAGAKEGVFADTDKAGVYQVRLTKAASGDPELRRFVYNVDPAEGDLTTVSRQELAQRLEGVKYQYEQASVFHYAVAAMAGYNLGEKLLYILVVLLMIEQVLAYACSYHPSARQPLAAKGGAR